jgi:4-carboxymuconolactone decarboxylase
MKVIRAVEALSGGEEGTGTFSGRVTLRSLARIDQPAGMAVVHFHEGARTHWHSHAGGQVLHVLTGRGRVQSEGQPVEELLPGDFVLAEAGEKHWHGAAEGASMAHISLAVGDPAWFEPVED